MKAIFKAILLIFVFNSFQMLTYAQSKDIGDWKGEQLFSPDSLAQMMKGATLNDVIIINTGPVQDIPDALSTGAVEHEKNLKKLIKLTKKLDKNKLVIIYCGCCPLVVCPNLAPAYNHLKQKGFLVKVLALETDLEEDWIGKGYPMPNKK